MPTEGETTIYVALLIPDRPPEFARADLATYYAGGNDHPHGFVGATSRLFSGRTFILGQPEPELGKLEFDVFGGWRGRVIDDAALADFDAFLEAHPTQFLGVQAIILRAELAKSRGKLAVLVTQPFVTDRTGLKPAWNPGGEPIIVG